jgi:diguanylate cyclase (GGDEF)-like protein
LIRGLPRVTAIVRIGADPQPSWLANAKGRRQWKSTEAPPRILACPIGATGEQLGFIGYLHDEGLADALAEAQARLVELATLLVIPARNAQRYAAALELAHRDPLTGLYNRRAFAEHLKREELRAERRGSCLCVVVFDLDRLKDINDSWGHDTGDRALCALAETLERAVRRGDIAARLGGDEFAVILPDTNAREAQRIGARVQRGLAAQKVPCGGGAALLKLGVGFGAADLAGAAGDVVKMMELADAELFVSKRSCRSGADSAGGRASAGSAVR